MDTKLGNKVAVVTGGSAGTKWLDEVHVFVEGEIRSEVNE
jgi:hypothetical protein